jgi:ATP-dependent Clp protease ATP-binding subunit ClpB
VDFKNTIVIMTSNLGSQIIKSVGADQERMEREIKDILEAHFRPEFLNRLDETVVFHTLSKGVLARILDLRIEELGRRLRTRRIEIELSPAVRKQLAERGYDPVFGARPLKRVLQQDIQNPLAVKLLEGGFGEGDKVKVDLDDKGDYRFSKAD